MSPDVTVRVGGRFSSKTIREKVESLEEAREKVTQFHTALRDLSKTEKIRADYHERLL